MDPATILGPDRSDMTVLVGWDAETWAANAATRALVGVAGDGDGSSSSLSTNSSFSSSSLFPALPPPSPVNGSVLGGSSFADLAVAADNTTVSPQGCLGAVGIAALALGGAPGGGGGGGSGTSSRVTVLGNASALFGESMSLTVASSAILCGAAAAAANASAASPSSSSSCALLNVSFAVMPQSAYEAAFDEVYDEVLKAVIAGLIVSFLIVLALPAQITPVLEEQVGGSGWVVDGCSGWVAVGCVCGWECGTGRVSE